MNAQSPALPNNRRLMAVVASLLAVNIAVSLVQLTGPASAVAAGPNDPPVMFPNNAAVQQKQLEILTEISAKLGRLEGKMDKGFNVKVTEMPEIKFPTQATDAQSNR